MRTRPVVSSSSLCPATLAALLLAGAPLPELTAAAERADWAPPRTLTVVVLPETAVRGVLVSLDGRTLRSNQDVPGLDATTELVVLLVPDAEGRSRPALRRSLEGRDAVVGPPRPWSEAAGSYARVARTLQLGLAPEGSEPLDTERRLADLVLRADGEALADLRARAPAVVQQPGPQRLHQLLPGGASRSPPRCSCTRRPSATGWASSASATARHSRTRAPCSS